MHTVLNQKLNLRVKSKENSTIFDSFDQNGVELPHGCLAGTCGACLIEITEGSESLNAPTEIEKRTLEKFIEQEPSLKNRKIRLSCRARNLATQDIAFNYIS